MQEGDLCSFEKGDGTFGVAKVLKLEEGIVHVRTYANTFSERPSKVDPDTLELGTVHDETFGLGHLPLASADFAAWRPEAFGNAPVHPDELEGYEIWREADGGVWTWPTERPTIMERIRHFLRRG